MSTTAQTQPGHVHMITDAARIDEILDRGTIVEILPNKADFRARLMSGERLRFYIGFDATAPTLHLSHAKNLMLLEKFRLLGHEVIVLFGDFTARIGDPSGESATRKQLTREEVVANVEAWKKLIRPLMNFTDERNPPLIRYNHDWLASMRLEDVLSLGTNFTVQQMLERDMFEKRLAANKPIYVHEFMYPLMQGYDSVAMDVDVELCGTDQIFNALAGRVLQKRFHNKEKFVVAVTLMANPRTGELMSKSKGTGVFLHANASEMYGQIMAQPDEMIELLFINNTHLPKAEIRGILAELGPRDAKMRLARELVALHHGEEQVRVAEDAFIQVFRNKEAPEDMTTVRGSARESIADLLTTHGLVSSKAEFRRLVAAGGIHLLPEDETLLDPAVCVGEGMTLRIGKRRFVKIEPVA